jgi:hypothetical protein
MFVVLDIDQTLADTAHRAQHLEKTPKDWDSFFDPSRVIKDKVIAGVENALAQLTELKCSFVILTERNENLRDVTTRWIAENLNIQVPEGHLLMRTSGNLLNPAEYKREQLLSFRQGLENKDIPFLIIDDDADVGTALKGLGIILKAPECWAVLFPTPAAPTGND